MFVLLRLYFLAFCGNTIFWILRPLLTVYVRDLGFSALLVGALSSAFMSGRGLFSVLIGILSDRLKNRKLFVIAGFFIFSLASYLISVSKKSYEFLLSSFLLGVASGSVWPVVQTMVVESVDSVKAGRSLSIYFNCGAMGRILGNFLLAQLSALFSGNRIFFFCALFYVLPFCISCFISDTYKEKVKPESSFASGSFLWFFIIIFLVGWIMGRAMIILYLKERFLMSTSDIAYVLMILSVVTIPLSYIISWVFDRNMRAGFLLLSSLLFLGVFLPLAGTKYLFVILLSLWFSGTSSFFSISRAYISRMSKNVGSAIGVLNTVSNAGTAIGPLFLGYIYDLFPKGSPLTMIGYSILSFVVCAGIWLTILKKR